MRVITGIREALGHAHQAQRLAIAFGFWHAVIAAHALLGVAALLMSDQHDGNAFEPRQSPDDGQVIAVHAIAVQFLPIAENHRHVVEGVGTLRMARQLRDLPGRKIGKNAGGQRPALGLQALDLFRDVDAGIGADEFQLLDLRLELRDGCSNSKKFIAMHFSMFAQVLRSGFLVYCMNVQYSICHRSGPAAAG